MKAEKALPKARILVVEDEVIVAKDLQKKLQNLGYDVPDVSFSGEDAIKKAAAMKPDLVLMDIMLKGKQDGVETAEQVRTKFDIPVIYLTAYSDEITLHRAKISEPYGYVLKPFDIHLVNISIEIALYKHRVEREKTKLLADLQDALAHVKMLKGLLPICAWCKKIRNDRGYWQELETYIHEHSDAEFSHGICPDCTEKYYKDFMEKRKKKKTEK
jgi:CheY-like chemotaxis protein